MNTISITTPQNIEVEFELASLGDRIVGRIIDGILIAGYFFLWVAIIGFSNLTTGSYLHLLIILIILPILLYDLLCEMFLNGQSLGKRVMGFKVISLSGEQPSLSQYLIRWLFRLVDFSLSFSLIGVIMVAASEKKQRLGDYVAGTVLVKTRPRTAFTDTISTPPVPVDYTVTYPEVAHLKDADVQLIKEVITSVHRTGNTMLAVQAQQKIEQVLQIRSRHIEAIDFLHVLLADYNYLASEL
ncbi:MAG: hypothetical protein JWQ96_967 [Segetibacter sp.]|nr:hypothetical protein [Segetibacter sp.]